MSYHAQHLLVDVWESSSPVLHDADAALHLCERILLLVGMALLATPTAVYADGKDKTWGPGATVILPLTDSHMSLHCLDEMGSVHFDLFSCKPFDSESVCATLRAELGGHGRMIEVDRCSGAVQWVKEW